MEQTNPLPLALFFRFMRIGALKIVSRVGGIGVRKGKFLLSGENVAV